MPARPDGKVTGVCKRLFLVVAMILLTGCSTLPQAVEREASYALTNPGVTLLGRMFAEAAIDEVNSGFVPLVSGTDAYEVRAAMAGLAEHTLDLQTYIWGDDLAGRAMLREVLAAAERGVRVRLLIDDHHTADSGVTFAAVNAHPHIEVRLFNPFGWRKNRYMDWLLDFRRINHRMHNKLMIADNVLAITGGRNIGDHYFAVDTETNFRDLDLLLAGPAVSRMSTAFDDYWNSEWAYPVDALDSAAGASGDGAAMIAILDAWFATQPEFPYRIDGPPEGLQKRLEKFREEFFYGPVHVVTDSPQKIKGNGDSDVADRVLAFKRNVEEELLMEVSYVIPGKSGLALLGELVENGVRVRILTNSLATNDIVPAHSGYLKYRRRMLAAGIELHELRPDAYAEQARQNALAPRSIATLHTKAIIYDRRKVFIGTLNMDPRSIYLNTENGLFIESPALAEHIAALIEEGMRPENSFELQLVDGKVRWRLVTEDGEVIFTADPETSRWTRFLAGLLALLPIEGHL